jgi:predicted transcriptional regulator
MASAGKSLLRKPDETMLANRLTRSARAVDNVANSLAEIREWIEERRASQIHEVELIRFDDLERWEFDAANGDLRHESGKFFRIQGLAVDSDYGAVQQWTQPIINQPEIGILGIIVKEIDGVLHCLMQAKSEPGNVNGVQISPTVQATRSNYLRVHEGATVPYLEYFQDLSSNRVLADVLQSEQGSWFYQKRNRNMIVEIDEPIELLDDFCWMTLGQLHELQHVDNMVNMDARTVLSCMPTGFEGTGEGSASALAEALVGSADPARGSLHTDEETMSWITSRESEYTVRSDLIPLSEVRQWQRTDYRIQHELGKFFSVIAVRVRANSREVAHWTQPLIEPTGLGSIAFLVKQVGGVLHVLVSARAEPGYLGTVELAPTVQCTPSNYDSMPAESRPPFLDLVLNRDQDRVLYDTELSEEGGRFYHACNRYQIIEVDEDFPDEGLPNHRWLTLHQLNGLLRHSNYVNVQARSLIACLRGL